MKLVKYALIPTLLIVFAGEAVARYFLGLGTPPLSLAHDRIEYMFAPNQDVLRFGNRQLYNEYGMRSEQLEDWGDARRVLVFGDSVLNGGNLTDHSALGTTLATNATVDTVFANVSAGSWGPGNVLGYVQTFGLFEADTAILVLSSHDAGDPPTFQPLDPTTHPTERPVSALLEAWTRYVPRYLPEALNGILFPSPSTPPDAENREFGLQGIDALPLLLARLAEDRVEACVVLHSTRSELQENGGDEFEPIDSLLATFTVPTVKMRDIWVERGSFNDAFRDDIHINELGQEVLAAALVRCDEAAVVPAEDRS
jgi:hypothetical protein